MGTDKSLLDKEYLTVEEVAAVFRVHWQTVLEYIRSGQLEAGKVGKSYRVTPDALLAFLRERTTGLSPTTLRERIDDLLSQEPVKSKRGIVLSAAFLPPVEIKNLFESDDQSYAELMRNPPTTRRMGWSFKTSRNDPRPVLGKYLEVKGGESFTLRLYKDGHLLAYGSAQSEFLAWAVNKDAAGNQVEGDNVNGLAIAEFMYNYSALVSGVIQRLGQAVKTINLHVFIHNPNLSKIKNIISRANMAFPLADYGAAVDVKELLLDASLSGEKADTQVIAAALWKEYSHAFGLLDDEVAYLSADKTMFSSETFKEDWR